ncbi:prolyl 3-hydroxylase OGFOD1-like [Paramacrobiotus metropolitanus]|uniref:prolyl 3-hydroxylase OGFOD1-like n=1 Tax=Paramacrobiotus metropolitanus TaxID=2943436 RepID=UPI00244578FE|nr:prolyl 3-hydroxylase OGFOD1-like [Paramacrobiotus metropolitanus]
MDRIKQEEAVVTNPKPVKREVDDASIDLPGRSQSCNGLHSSSSAKRIKSENTVIQASDQLAINPAYCTSDFQNAVCSLLKLFATANANLDATGAEHAALLKNMVFRRPFSHMIFPNFFTANQAIEQVENELLSQKFQAIHKDLFQLSQTKELRSVPEFAMLCRTLENEVHDWVSAITGVPLSDEVDVRGAMYRYTDRLMCHDDKLTTRKVAYVYYLTDAEDWDVADGGTLDLFDSLCVDLVMVPGEIVKRIPPKRNSLVLFLVRDDSFHQVSEIVNPRKSRLSITGWFHSPQSAAAIVEYQTMPASGSMEFTEADQNNARICKLARQDDRQSEIWKAKCRETFLKQQRLNIPEILDLAFYRTLVSELREKDHLIPWMTPSNRNQAGHYRYFDLRQRFVKDFKCLDLLVDTILTDQFLQSVSDITAINMGSIISGPPDQSKKPEENAKENKPFATAVPGSSSDPSGEDSSDTTWFLRTVQFRLERFAHQDYTLKNYDAVQQGAVLDLFLFFDCDRLDKDCGGTIVYVDMDNDDDCLPLTKFSPVSNTLQMVRREDSVVFYTDYVNHRWARRADGRPFYRLWMSVSALPSPPGSSTSGSEHDVDSDEDESAEDDDDDENFDLDEDNQDAIPPTVSGSSEDELEE